MWYHWHNSGIEGVSLASLLSSSNLAAKCGQRAFVGILGFEIPTVKPLGVQDYEDL